MKSIFTSQISLDKFFNFQVPFFLPPFTPVKAAFRISICVWGMETSE